MADLIIVVVLLVAVGAAVAYIIKAKRNGAKCIGCPACGNCPGRHRGHEKCAQSRREDEKENS